jgi:hypothetical protein
MLMLYRHVYFSFLFFFYTEDRLFIFPFSFLLFFYLYFSFLFSFLSNVLGSLSGETFIDEARVAFFYLVCNFLLHLRKKVKRNSSATASNAGNLTIIFAWTG